MIEQLEQIAPVTAISGNVDDDQSGLPPEAVIELAGLRIATSYPVRKWEADEGRTSVS